MGLIKDFRFRDMAQPKNMLFDEANLSSAIWIDGKKCALGSIGVCN